MDSATACELLEQCGAWLWTESATVPEEEWRTNDPLPDAWTACESGVAMLHALEGVDCLQLDHALGYSTVDLAPPGERPRLVPDDWRHRRSDMPIGLYVVRPDGRQERWRGTDRELADEVRRRWPTLTFADVRRERKRRFAPGVPHPERPTFLRNGSVQR